MSKIQQLSKLLYCSLSSLLLLIATLSIRSAWLDYGQVMQPTKKGLVQIPLSGLQSGVVCLIKLLPTLVMVLMIYFLIKLLKLFSQGIVFSSQNYFYLRWVGTLLLAKEVMQLLMLPSITFLITLPSAHLKNAIIFSVGLADMSNVLIGISLILLSLIMHEAQQLKEENIAFL